MADDGDNLLCASEVLKLCDKEISSTDAENQLRKVAEKSVDDRCRENLGVSGDLKTMINTVSGLKVTSDASNRIDTLGSAIDALSQKGKKLKKSMNTSLFATETELLGICATTTRETLHSMNGNYIIDPVETAKRIAHKIDEVMKSNTRDLRKVEIEGEEVNEYLSAALDQIEGLHNEELERNFDFHGADSFAVRLAFLDKHFNEFEYVAAAENRKKLFTVDEAKRFAKASIQPTMWEYPTPLSFMLPMVNVEKIEKAKKPPVKKIERDSKKEKPQLVRLTDRSSNATVQYEEVSIMKELEHVYKSLRSSLKERNTDSIPYYEFILNPDDFAKTVENMFYVSYIIRDRRAYLVLEDGRPMLKSAKSLDEKTKEKMDESSQAQGISNLNYHQWTMLRNKFKTACIAPKTI
ncbi:unnamed protein product [Caenorhabditis bovis]|uniref:Non-structural maintenance of chromosomes element 4 n=1 Tax=Caenorhabditis bovis TaxID=2654633 RepID=A0A8S1EZP3_9PELO|nr:unnamed protein product [Caenorhabditis bovis]